MSGWNVSHGFSSVGSDHLALKPTQIQVRGLNMKKTRGYKYRRSAGGLVLCPMANVEECTALSKIDEQEDIGPLESELWEKPLSDIYPARGRELRYSSPRFNLPRFKSPQSRPALARHYMGPRSAQFEQMDGNPSDNYNRQESTIPDRESSHALTTTSKNIKSM